MDLPNFKDILQKLSVFKNTSLLIPVVIVLISILLFIPTQLMSSGLKKEIQKESISVLSRVQNLSQKAVSDELLEQKTKQLQTRANDANEIARLAIQTSQKQLLSYDVFDVNDPNSLSGLIFLQFGQQFIGGIDKLIASANAGDCPTEAELIRAIEESGANSRSRLGRSGTYDTRTTMPTMPIPRRSSVPGGPLPGMRMRSELERVVVDQTCQKRAKEVSFYVNPAELSGYEFWKEYDINVQKVQAVEDCWYYQLAYWVIEDVFDTINSMNSGHENVLSAPVKRLMRLGFTMNTNRARIRRGSFRGRRTVGNKDSENDDRPKYVLSSDEETKLTESCTGRYSDEDIDVIHFNVVCVVSTKDIMSFMKELCSAKEHKYIDESGKTHTYMHNQITILETNINSVDREIDHNSYRFGDSGVVELELICEYIFNKKGYENNKPESVKTTLLGEEDK